MTDFLNYLTTHQALLVSVITSLVLAYHTIMKGVADSRTANPDKKGLDLFLTVFRDVLVYVFKGQRAA